VPNLKLTGSKAFFLLFVQKFCTTKPDDVISHHPKWNIGILDLLQKFVVANCQFLGKHITDLIAN
jgi:hypothetical protein